MVKKLSETKLKDINCIQLDKYVVKPFGLVFCAILVTMLFTSIIMALNLTGWGILVELVLWMIMWIIDTWLIQKEVNKYIENVKLGVVLKNGSKIK